MADAPPPEEDVPLDIPVIENLESDTRDRIKWIGEAEIRFTASLDDFRLRRRDDLPAYPERAKNMTLKQATAFRRVLRDYCNDMLDPAIEAREVDIAKAERSLAALATAKKRAEAEIYEEAAAHFAGAAKKQKKDADTEKKD